MLAVAVLVGSGCGGGDGEETVSRAEYLQRADAICAGAEDRKNAALEAEFARREAAGEGMTRQDELTLVRRVALPPIDRMVEQLAALPDPARAAAKAASIVAAFEAATEAVAENPASALADSTPFDRANALASEFGLEACAAI